jgi:hypothetical protein
MKAALAEQSEKKPAAAESGGWYALSASLLVAHENPHLPVTRRIPYGSCRVFVAVGRRLKSPRGAGFRVPPRYGSNRLAARRPVTTRPLIAAELSPVTIGPLVPNTLSKRCMVRHQSSLTCSNAFRRHRVAADGLVS